MSEDTWADLSSEATFADVKKTTAVAAESAVPAATEAKATSPESKDEAKGDAGADIDPEIEIAQRALEKAKISEDAKVDDVEVTEYGLRAGEIKITGIAEGSSQSTIYSAANTFEELNLAPELLRALAEMNFQRPSKIQAQALPIILSGQSLVGQAHHGSGKTATYSLGMISMIDPSIAEPQAICITPTRELAIQVAEVIDSLTKFSQIRRLIAVRGAARAPVKEQIVVGTPGTILAKIKSRELPTKKIKMIVLDEADVLVDTQALGKDCADIRKACPKAQALLFSATFDDRVSTLVNKIVGQTAVKIEVQKESLALSTLAQFAIECSSSDERYEMLGKIYELLTIRQSMIFCNSIATAKQLTNWMTEKGYQVSVTYGGSGAHEMKAELRDEQMKAFKEGRTTVLITTNLLARGVDVPAVSLVVNFDVPVDRANRADPDTYIHRINRAGRFGRFGCAINLVHDKPSKHALKAIEMYFKRECIRLPDDEDIIEKCVKDAIEGKEVVVPK